MVRDSTFSKSLGILRSRPDLSSSLQRKQQQMERLKRRSELLSDLQASGDWAALDSCEDAEPFREPQPSLPLWSRIDRRFWWNEHLIQPFVEKEVIHFAMIP